MSGRKNSTHLTIHSLIGSSIVYRDERGGSDGFHRQPVPSCWAVSQTHTEWCDTDVRCPSKRCPWWAGVPRTRHHSGGPGPGRERRPLVTSEGTPPDRKPTSRRLTRHALPTCSERKPYRTAGLRRDCPDRRHDRASTTHRGTHPSGARSERRGK
jgi:hypothetical protein